MYICPSCEREFSTEAGITKHLLQCWRDKNLNHRSKDAPRSEDINTREASDDVINFFASFQKE